MARALGQHRGRGHVLRRRAGLVHLPDAPHRPRSGHETVPPGQAPTAQAQLRLRLCPDHVGAGDMGASKSVSAAEEAFWWFQRGHPFFQNGGFNFGRIVESTDIYEVIANVPMYSVIAIDEAYTGLESGMSMSTGVRGFAILCAGLRKKGCKLLLLPAMARPPSPSPTIVRETTTTPPPPAAWWNSPPVVELPSGVDTVVTVRVTAEDGSHQNYVITIHRASS